MRTLLVALVAAFLLTSVAGCKSECERAAEKYCQDYPDKVGYGGRDRCEAGVVISCNRGR